MVTGTAERQRENTRRPPPDQESPATLPSVGKRHLILAIVLPMAVVLTPWVAANLLPPLVAWPVTIGVEIVLIILGIRQLNKYVARRLDSATAKGKQRWPVRDIPHSELVRFQRQLQMALGHEGFTSSQLDLFALALADPAAVRRRCTDRYQVGGRVLKRSMSLEFDLDLSLHPDQIHQQDDDGSDASSSPAQATHSVSRLAKSLEGQQKFLPVLLLRKGVLHDYSRLVDSAGHEVSALSYKEYRLLAGLTLRRLLIAAYDGPEQVASNAWEVESEYFKLLLQFGIINQGPQTTDTRVNEVVGKIEGLIDDVGPNGQRYIRLLARFVRTAAYHYAVVAVLPTSTPNRFFLTYESTEIPNFLRPLTTDAKRLSRTLGDTSLKLDMSAANSATCQSYHLLAEGPEGTYLAAFETPFIRQDDDLQVPTDSSVSYHRVRGRRGQRYFHLYSRLGSPRVEGETDGLNVRLRFHEVPPGTIGRAALSAVISLVVLIFVAIASQVPHTLPGGTQISAVDGNIAAFLLALPGLAAVWLGLDATQPRLVARSPFVTRLSLGVTFLTSVAATVLLLFQKTGAVSSTSQLGISGPHWSWFVILAIAAVNSAVAVGMWWQRLKYFQTLARRPSGASSYMYYD